MASRNSGAGAFIAIGILAILAGAFGYLFYDTNNKKNELDKVLRTGSVDQLITQDPKQGAYNNENVKKVLIEKENEKAKVLAREKVIDDLKLEIEAKGEEIEEWKTSFRKSEQELEGVNTNLSFVKNELEQRANELSELRSQPNRALMQQIDNLKQELERAQANEEILSRKLAGEKELRETIKKQLINRIRELERQVDGLQRVVNQKMDLESGRQRGPTEDYDGKVVEVDVQNRFVVINLGSAHRIRKGMRFDVRRWRLNKWDYMGAIEVKTVHPTVSEAVILDEIVRKKICPVTGYIAENPEMKVSPFARSGVNQDKVVPLIDAGVDEKPGMRQFDPIVAGDYITNPFYSRDRRLRFVVAGEKVEYSQREIEQMIENYGGIVQDAVDVKTDYLVLGLIPDETMVTESEDTRRRIERAKKAKETAELFGIPIMREVELFNFLRQ